MGQLVGGELGWVVVKSTLLYLTAVVAFRIGRRRTIAEMSPYDFVAAIAVGGIIGRVPNSSSTSYLAGALTLITILILHACLTWLRYQKKLAVIIDHPPRLLIADGRLQEKDLRDCGLTESDLFGVLRQHGVTDLKQVAYVIFEQRGKISIIRNDASSTEGGLVRKVVEQVRGNS